MLISIHLLQMDSNWERGKWLLFGGYHLHWPGRKYALRGEGFRWDSWSQMYRRWNRCRPHCGGIWLYHFSIMSFIALLAEYFPYAPCNFTLDCHKMDNPCGDIQDVGCWCLFGQCVISDEGEKKECSETEDCAKMDKCANGHCYCSESTRAGNKPSQSLKFYIHGESPYPFPVVVKLLCNFNLQKLPALLLGEH